MIEIDGAEGGGQILRTAIGLSALTGQSCSVKNIRASRPQSGLKEQHLQGVSAITKLCGGKLEGAEIGARQVEFFPGKIKSGSLRIDIGTAGSVGLILQALLIPAVRSKGLHMHIRGGATFGKWAPPISWLQNVLLPALGSMGYMCRIEVRRHGYYPEGGAEVEVETAPVEKLYPLGLTGAGKYIFEVHGLSNASKSLQGQNVAERQMKAARELIFKEFNVTPKIDAEYADSRCPGSGIALWAETENSLIGADALGERGKRAEDVGKEAAEKLIAEIKAGAAVDRHLADNLIPYLGMAGGAIRTSEITQHVMENIKVAEKFLPMTFRIDGSMIYAAVTSQATSE
jgi:RNA 3'-terminal phosphate cyclase (GTP)